MTLGISIKCNNAEFQSAESHVLLIVILNIIMLSVVMQSDMMLSIVMLIIVMLNVVAYDPNFFNPVVKIQKNFIITNKPGANPIKPFTAVIDRFM